tara:strand:- start:3953 stop:4069 length:117 start_codon:yes stop_codon:yes gene_type:complete
MGTEHPDYLQRFDLVVGNQGIDAFGAPKTAEIVADKSG